MVFSASSAPSAVNDLDEDTFEINVVQSGLITLNIDLFNSGEENSILEYAVFTSTEPSGVTIENEKGNIAINDSKIAVVYINPDYIEEGTSSFDVIVNSNGQTGESSQTYKIILNKYYQSWYQDWSFPEEKPTVMNKPVVLTRYTYTGREYNRETAQYYYRARTYISSIGRFTGKDPWTWQPDDERIKNFNKYSFIVIRRNHIYIISFNNYLINYGSINVFNETKYNYVRNNPLLFYDTFGYNIKTNKEKANDLFALSAGLGGIGFLSLGAGSLILLIPDPTSTTKATGVFLQYLGYGCLISSAGLGIYGLGLYFTSDDPSIYAGYASGSDHSINDDTDKAGGT